MSRIGRLTITLPAEVKFDYTDGIVTVTGPKGTLKQEINSKNIDIAVENGVISVTRTSENKDTRSKHGLYRMLIANMVAGVVTPFTKTVIVHGVGYKANINGNKLTMNIGYSHPIEYVAPEGITITCPDQNTIVVTGISKEQVGQVAAIIKSKRKVEPYHLYGLRYSTEKVTKKEGKTAGK